MHEKFSVPLLKTGTLTCYEHFIMVTDGMASPGGGTTNLGGGTVIIGGGTTTLCDGTLTSVVECQTEVVERHSGAFRLNLTTALTPQMAQNGDLNN